MAESRMRISVNQKDQNFQVRIAGFSSREGKRLLKELNIFPGNEALERMEGYEDLRSDEYFRSSTGEICFGCEYGRLALLRKMADDSGASFTSGEELVPNSEKSEEMLARTDPLSNELEELLAAARPFYKKGAKSLLAGLALRIAVVVLVAIIGRLIYVNTADHYIERSLQAVMKTSDQPYVKQNFISFFWQPEFTHRSMIKINRPLYIKGGNVILEGGHYIQIEGVGNLKASIEARNNAPVTIRIDTRGGEMRIVGLYVGEETLPSRGLLRYLGRIPVSAQPPARVDALDTNSSGAYVRVRDADPVEEATFNWMLGQTVSVTASLTLDQDRYLIGEGEFYFAVLKSTVRPEVQEILDIAAISNQRVIFDMRLSTRPLPMRNRRDARMQRRDTNIISEGSLHYVTIQSAVLKNI